MARIIAIALFLVPAAALAQQAGPDEKVSPPASAPCTLEGIVASAASGEPIRNAMVSLIPEVWDKRSFLRYTTEAGGRFIFRRARPGRYRLQADAPGYTIHSYGQRSPNSKGMLLTLTPGCRLRDLELRLLPGGAISGMVFGEDGVPAVGAYVAALRLAFGPQPHGGGYQAETDDRGQYRIFGLSPGGYLVRAIMQQAVVRKTAKTTLRSHGFYLGTPDISSAIPVEVRAGDEIPNVDIVVHPIAGVSVRGRVTSYIEAALRGHGFVYLVPSGVRPVLGDLLSLGASLHVKTGFFEITDVPGGSYLALVSVNVTGHAQFARATLEVFDHDVEGVHLVLAQPVQVSGRVRAEPEVSLDFTRLRVALMPHETPLKGGWPIVTPKKDGSFSVPDVSPETYRVEIYGLPEGFFLKSARLGGVDALREGFMTLPAGSVGQLEITISANGGRIEGRVIEDGEPAPGATVALIPNAPHRHREDMYRLTQTDQHGTFSLTGIPPGDFKLFAWDVMEGEAYKADEFIEKYESKGKAIRIEEGQVPHAELHLTRAEEFALE